ncbi:MAG: NUDIX domain-containing protein [Flavobacteriaceae bacterium]|nr:NUDIX domain-containing protein [Flavobacteriaceae bacterium]
MRLGIRSAVMAVLINQEGKVLIGSSPRDGGYKFPQGGREPFEDVITCIKRELREELNFIVNDGDIEQVYDQKVSYEFPDDGYYIFDSQELTVVKIRFQSHAELTPQDDEFDELLWIKPEELCNYDSHFRGEAYQKALEICGLM